MTTGTQIDSTPFQPSTTPRGISLRDLAARVGVSHTNIVKLYASGRLGNAIQVNRSNGRPVVTDPARVCAVMAEISLSVAREALARAERCLAAPLSLDATQLDITDERTNRS
ncbi:MAG: hypothetical protein FJ027_04385 [Candidatus Rokubacteria bacterium]|nr:hypothetical protein [Candidatus Rokubacteria bacterium]